MDNVLLTNIEKLLKEGIERPLTFNEACEFLSVSKSFLYKLTHKKLIPHYKPNGKKIYFSKAELANWLLKKPVKTKQEIEEQATNYVTIKGE